jgi:mono/diheme cytochrome c family protein
MVVKYFEYRHKIHENLVWGLKFYEDPHPGEPGALVAVEVEEAADPVKGREMWMATCRACHGLAGEGITGQGKDIRGSEFIAGKTDKDLVSFIKGGRMPFDPLNTTGIQMPPKGGNPLLKAADLEHIVAFIRTFEAPPAAAEGAGAADEPVVEEASPAEAFWIPVSSIPPPPVGPDVLDGAALAELERPWHAADAPLAEAAHVEPDHVNDPDRPTHVHLFFAIYYCMTGLHGIHVVVGIGVLSWLLVRAALGHFSSAYFTPVDLVGLYWHVVDLIWIFLFPLFYLIH